MKKQSLLAVMFVVKKIRALSYVAPLVILLAGAGLAFGATIPFDLPLSYHFNVPGTLLEAPAATTSSSLYLWLSSGSRLTIVKSIASTATGTAPLNSPAQEKYAASAPVKSDNGAHPQNLFRMFLKDFVTNPSAQIYFNRVADNLSDPANRTAYIGESLFARYQGDNYFYYGGIRADGAIVIKKNTGGTYQTLAYTKILPGTYNKTTNYDLIPLKTWIGLKFVVTDGTPGPHLSVYTDIGRTGTWKLALSVVDDPKKFGAPVQGAGLVGIESDYADAQFDQFSVSNAAVAIAKTPAPTPSPAPSPTPPPPPPPPTPSPTPTPPPAPPPPPPPPTPAPTPAPITDSTGTYDSLVLADNPVMYLKMNSPKTGKESDMTGNGHSGTYAGGAPSTTALPNGNTATVFNGSSEYLTVPSSAALSIPTTHMLTWEAWIRPDTLNFSTASDDGYVDWMGKCENYSPTCEWEARMYNAVTAEGRPDRFSAYVFNSSAGLGSGADWQPANSWLSAGQWVHVVAEYQTQSTPSGCPSSTAGSINIWVNGIKQNLANHMPTGCMSQFSITPKANSSPLNIGTMAMDTWFKGAIGKVAVYNHLLTQTQISAHFKAMSGKSPSGSCGETCTATMP